MSVTVRQPTEADTGWILSQLKAAEAYYGAARSLFPDNASERLATVLESGIARIAERDSKPVGIILGLLHEHILNPDIKQATALVLWVSPGDQQKGAGGALIDAFTDAARSAGVHWIVLPIQERTASNLPDSFFTSRNYRSAERVYLQEVA